MCHPRESLSVKTPSCNEQREPRDKVSVLYVIPHAQYFCFCLQCAGVLLAASKSFVCSALEFCLQCAGVLFAACNSFDCSVLEFCFQRACWSFVWSVREFCLQRVILLRVVCMYFFNSFSSLCLQYAGDEFFDVYLCLQGIFFICSVFSLLKRCPLWAAVRGGCRGCARPPHEMTIGFLIQLVFTFGHQSVTTFLSGAPLPKKILDPPLTVHS